MMEKTRCLGCMKVKTGGVVCEHCGFHENTPNASHQLAVGTVLKEQYQIGRVLGQGGFGITYLGWDLYLDIPVAIKEYYPSGMVVRENTMTMNVTDISNDEGVRFRNNRDRFMREAKMLARFSQVPQIVQVKNFFLANNTAYIVMEYVEGISLKQYVQNQGGKLSVRETLAILGPVIKTLGKVHKTGVIHRDISPNNIMMVDGSAKVLDFGAVRDLNPGETTGITKTTEAIVTQGYAPTEQYLGKGLGSWTDVYALCATIYYCLTGEVPPDSLTRIMEGDQLNWDNVKGLTPKQKDALIHGMQLLSDARTRTMDELYQELMVEPEPPVPPVPPVPPQPPEPKKKVKKQPARKTGQGVMFLGLCAVAAVLVLAVFALNRSRTAEETQQILAQFQEGNVISGMCGDAARWYLDPDTGVLKIDGVHMYDFYLETFSEEERQNKHPRPWQEYTDLITEVVLDNNLHRLGSASFADCPNLKKVSFGIHLKEIGSHAFRYSGLEQVVLPSSVEVIEHSAFEGTKLREISLPILITNLGHVAFADCPNLETVEILGCVQMNFDTWNPCPIFSRDDNRVDGITIWAPPGGNVQEYARIYGYSFEPMGSGVIYEAQGYFSAFPGNTEGRWYFDKESGFLKIEGEMPVSMKGQWEVENNEVAPERKVLPFAPWLDYREDIVTVSIGEGVTRISENAFAGCNNLTDIHLPSTLKSIGFQSFLGTNVDEIVIPDSVTDISEFAFNHCRNLYSVKLPADLAALEPSVFNCCFALERVYMGESTQLKSTTIDGQLVTPFNSATDHDSEVNENLMPANLTLVIPPESQPGSVSAVEDFSTKFGVAFEKGAFTS